MVHVCQEQVGHFNQRNAPPRRSRPALVRAVHICPLPIINVSASRGSQTAPLGIEEITARSPVSQFLPSRLGKSETPEVSRTWWRHSKENVVREPELCCSVLAKGEKLIVTGDGPKVSVAPLLQVTKLPGLCQSSVRFQSTRGNQRWCPLITAVRLKIFPPDADQPRQLTFVFCLIDFKLGHTSSAFGEQQQSFFLDIREYATLK